MKKFLSAVCLVALCGGVVNAAQCPSWKAIEDEPGLMSKLVLTGQDDLNVKDVIVNRGNCMIMHVEEVQNNFIKAAEQKYGKNWQTVLTLGTKLSGSDKELLKVFDGMKFPIKPFKLGFGQQKNFAALCTYDSILEVTVKTDSGDCVMPVGR